MIDPNDENDVVGHLVEWAKHHKELTVDSESIRNRIFEYAFNLAIASSDRCMIYLNRLLDITWSRSRRFMEPRSAFVVEFHIDCRCANKIGLLIVFTDTFMMYKLIDRQTKLTVSETDPRSLASIITDLYLTQFRLSIDTVAYCEKYISKGALLDYTINKFTGNN